MEYGPDDKEKEEMEPEVKEIPAPAAPPVAAPASTLPPVPAPAVAPPVTKATAKPAKPTKKALVKKGAKKAASEESSHEGSGQESCAQESTSTQITVARGFEASTPGAWSAGARLKRLSPLSGFNGDVEWGCAISNITVTGDGSLKVGGGSDRIEEADPRCKYTGSWGDYKYAGGFPSQWWMSGMTGLTGFTALESIICGQPWQREWESETIGREPQESQQ
jgi:hypothetical protein